MIEQRIILLRFILIANGTKRNFAHDSELYEVLALSLTNDVVHAEGLAAQMTVLRDFIAEIGNALNARKDKPLAPHY